MMSNLRAKIKTNKRIFLYLTIMTAVLICVIKTAGYDRSDLCHAMSMKLFYQKVLTTAINGSWYDRHFVMDPYRIPVLINNADVCRDKHTKLLIYVYSSADNFFARNRIRNTWGNPRYNLNGTIAVLFVIGNHYNETANLIIQKESKQHSDILQMDYHDTYNNVSYKGLNSLKWINDNCNNVKYIIKTDDDCVVNIYAIHELLRKTEPFGFSDSSSSIQCMMMLSQHPVSRCGRHGVDTHNYPGLVFADYCHGAGYIMPYRVVDKLYRASFHVSFLRLDDVFISGEVRQVAGDVSIHQLPYEPSPNFEIFQEIKIYALLRNSETLKKHLFVHINDKYFMSVWQRFVSIYSSINDNYY